MRTDSPGPVVSQIGAIEDALAIEQNAHAEAKALEFRRSQELKILNAGFKQEAEGPNQPARDAWVAEQLAETPQYIEWIDAKEQLVKHEVRFDYLSKRLSACQSVLKNFQVDATAGRYGQGAPQSGGEPDG